MASANVSPSDDAVDRVLTVPNAITVARVALFAWFLLLLFQTTHRVAAAVVLGVAGSTDFLDGWFARRFHQVSTVGKILDPTVDRLLLGGGIVAVAAYGATPWWVAGIVLGREAFVAVTGVVLGALGARRIDVLYIGKVATFGLMCAFPLLLLGDGVGTLAHVVRVVGYVILTPSFACSLYATWAYVPAARNALRLGRSDRRAPTP